MNLEDKVTPHFKSAMELIAHSKTHAKGMNDLDKRLVILHLANAVEFILKDLLLIKEISIFDKNPTKTITVQGCISKLKDIEVTLDNFNGIQLLINQRNSLQHSFGSISDDMVRYYLSETDKFFASFLETNYGLNYKDIITKHIHGEDTVLYGYSDNNNDIEKIKILSKIHPLSSYLSTWYYLETITNNLIIKASFNKNFKIPSDVPVNKVLKVVDIILPNNIEKDINKAYSRKLEISKNNSNITTNDVTFLVNITEKYEQYISSLDVKNIKESVSLFKEEMNSIKDEIKDLTIKDIYSDKNSFEDLKIEDLFELLTDDKTFQLIKFLKESGLADSFEKLIKN